MGILLFILKSIDISLILKMKNGFSWPAKIMASPFKCIFSDLFSLSLATLKVYSVIYFPSPW